jgi:cytochrome c biogenesis protein CcdA/thiol-disulfide isomerase/thioredoxin
VVLLIAFAFVAGAGTALSPCVLPVLPAVLSAGVTGGRRRPLGVVTGLAVSFTFAVVALVYVIEALGLPDDLLRNVAIAVLFVFGLALLVPPLSDRIEAWISRLVGAPAMRRGEGFGSGFLLGASLGFVYAPCAGPILAGVITVSAAQDFTVGRLAVALAYGIGSAVVLYLFVLGGRRIADRLSAYSGRIQVALGVVMVATAALMVADLDIRFQTAIADDLPSALVNPTGDLEESGAVAEDLAAVRGGGHAKEAGTSQVEHGLDLPVLGRAPDFTDTQQWFNTPGGEALSIKDLTDQGHVVLIDFWTYTCINCIRTLPYVTSWDQSYRDDGLTIVGVHSPEFPFEKDPGNVATAIADNGIEYPVVQDNELGTWNAFGNQYWPAKYLIDADGNVRYVHFGEGGYATTEQAIRILLADAGDDSLGSGVNANAERADPGTSTPETYLGAARAQGFVNGPIKPGTQSFGRGPAPASLPPDSLAYRGRWEISQEDATAGPGAAIDLHFGARRVFCVLGSPGEPRQMRVLLDGDPIPDRLAGADVSDGVATIDEQRLYRLVELPRAERHILTLEPEPGTSGYAFTFG